jgi:hypothetical protein
MDRVVDNAQKYDQVEETLHVPSHLHLAGLDIASEREKGGEDMEHDGLEGDQAKE